MSRATPEDVRAINGSTADDATIQPYLDTAHIIVNKVLTCANTDEETLTQAEAYLAAHYMALTGAGGEGAGTVKSESIQGQSISYNVSSISGQGTLSTAYGQIANSLLGGCLAMLDGKKAAVGFTGGAG